MHNTLNSGLATALFAILAAGVASAQPVSEDVFLIGSDTAAGDWFGVSVAIDNGLAVAGALGETIDGKQGSGAAYLFNAVTGAQLDKLTPDDPSSNAKFGTAVAIDGDLIAIGARTDSIGTSVSRGAAYVFQASTGLQLHKLEAQSQSDFGDDFGISIDIDDGIVVIGVRNDDDNGTDAGAAYLFDAITGVQLFKLLADDGGTFDNFGSSVAIQDGVVAVGSPAHREQLVSVGAVYLFDATTGLQTDKLLATDGGANDKFGWTLAMDDGVLATGAYWDDDDDFNAGAAYLFDIATGTQTDKLFPADPGLGHNFGYSIEIADGILIVGSPWDDTLGFRAGSSYVFEVSTGLQIAKLVPSDSESDDAFGWSLASSNGLVVAGAYHDEENGTFAGSAYVFGFEIDCTPDMNNDGILDNGDIGLYVDLFLAGDPAADMNNDGILDNGDIGTFVDLFLAGC